VNKPLTNNFSRLKSDVGLRDYFAIILRRKLVIIICLLSLAASTVFYVYRIEDVFESYSILVIEEKNPVISEVMNVGGRAISFYEGIINSRTFLELTLDSIGLDVFKTTFPKFIRSDAITYIQNSISLRKTEYASFFHLNCRAKSRELAYFIATVATDIFQKRCQDVESEESRRAVVEIDNQLKVIREKLEKAEYDFRTFRDRTGNILEGLPPELKNLQETYAENLALLGVKEADLSAEKAQLTKLEVLVTPEVSQSSPEVSKLRSRLKELEKERMRLENLGIRLSSTSTIEREIFEVEQDLLQYKQTKSTQSTDPNVIRQWQTLRKSVLSKEAELDLFKGRLESYQKAIKSYKKDNPNILSESLELLRLKRSKEIYENIYNILLEKAEEQRILSASSGAGIKIVDIARMPENPISKNEMRYYILGVILGLGLGLALAFIMEFNDTSVKSNDDIERYLNLPVLGTIPHISFNKKEELKIKRKSSKSSKETVVTQYPRHLLNFSGDESVTAEAYRSLRTNLSFVSPDNPVKCIVITSSGPSEGKSLTISNLALAYAQMGKRTLLIDTDLRRPVLHHIFNVKREPGFTDLFASNAQFDVATRPTQNENLTFIPAGIFTPNPAELIASQKMATLIDYLKENYDMIFFDTPPIIAVTDAPLLGTKVDGVLLVVRSHKTSREVAERAVSNLTNVGVKCIGAVLNDINLSHHYSSYGYYKYYYHYYKSKV